MNSRHGSYLWTSVFVAAYYLLTVMSNSSAYSKEALPAGVEPAVSVTSPATPFDIYLSLEKRVSGYTKSLPQLTSKASRHLHF